jgi:VIT1/CCC1 family predicted Fe2+/Mn2+ transporter
MLAMEAEELKKMPETELRELARMYERKGLSRETARRVAGTVQARLGFSPWRRAVLRNVGGGLVAMGITYLVGSLVGPHV